MLRNFLDKGAHPHVEYEFVDSICHPFGYIVAIVVVIVVSIIPVILVILIVLVVVVVVKVMVVAVVARKVNTAPTCQRTRNLSANCNVDIPPQVKSCDSPVDE